MSENKTAEDVVLKIWFLFYPKGVNKSHGGYRNIQDKLLPLIKQYADGKECPICKSIARKILKVNKSLKDATHKYKPKYSWAHHGDKLTRACKLCGKDESDNIHNKMNEPKHTKLPWKLNTEGLKKQTITSEQKKGFMSIASVHNQYESGDYKANAEFIVKACNSYYDNEKTIKLMEENIATCLKVQKNQEDQIESHKELNRIYEAQKADMLEALEKIKEDSKGLHENNYRTACRAIKKAKGERGE